MITETASPRISVPRFFKRDRFAALERRIVDMLPSEAFRNELTREMLRSDRTACPMTLLVFELRYDSGKRIANTHDLEELATTICNCSRKTDIKGWYRDGHGMRISLILHHTNPDRCQRIVDTVRTQYRLSATTNNGHGLHKEVACEIYAYPGDREEEKVNGPQQLWLFDDETLANMEWVAPADDHHRNGDFAGDRRMQGRVPIVASANCLLEKPLPFWKRTMDVIGSGAGLVFLSPFLAMIALAIKLTSKGPVFFKQERVGYLGKTFLCWKFRTMRADADPRTHQKYLHKLIQGSSNDTDQSKDRPMMKLDDANPQITAIGRILRKTSVDELAQLINVFKGEMSLVGPRPCLPYEAEKYMRWHKRRFDTIPGITGLWQVKGKNRTTFKQMIRLDINYTRHRSLWLDIKILLMTPFAVLSEVRASSARKKAAAVVSSLNQEA